MKLEISPEAAASITLQQTMNFSYKGKTGTGYVSMIAPASGDQSKLIAVELSLDQSSLSLLDKAVLGDVVEVSMNQQFSQVEQIILPFASIMSNTSSEYSVFVVTGGKIERRPVTL